MGLSRKPSLGRGPNFQKAEYWGNMISNYHNNLFSFVPYSLVSLSLVFIITLLSMSSNIFSRSYSVDTSTSSINTLPSPLLMNSNSNSSARSNKKRKAFNDLVVDSQN